MVTHDRTLRVVAPGVQATVQDFGRRDVARYGLSPSGAADWFSAAAANLLVGNASAAALIETTLTGASFEMRSAARIALTGARASLTIDDMLAAQWCAHDIRAGATIELSAAQAGARSYLAVDGGVVVPLVFDSAATDLGAALGGFGGRALRAGDEIVLGAPRARDTSALVSCQIEAPQWESAVTLRLLPGPHRASIAQTAWQTLFDRTWGVSSRSTRQGVQLDGEPLPLAGPTDVISAGAYAGCVQVTSAGIPVVLLTEHQTTGGYATVACTIAADVWRAGQLRPGDRVRFAQVSRVEAVRALRERMAALSGAAPLP